MSSPRPLVMRCGAFGDMVLLTALLRQMLLRFGTPADLITAGRWSVPLLAGQPGVGEICLLRSRKSPYWASRSQQRLVSWLRARGAGPTWYCDGGAGRELLRKGQVPDDFVLEDESLPRVPGEHFVDRWIRFADATPAAFAGTLPPSVAHIERRAAIDIDAVQRRALDEWLSRRGLLGRPLVLLQPGNKRTTRGLLRQRATNTKYWPEERWGEVVRGVRAARADAAILLLGVPWEFALNGEIMRLAQARDVYNVADELPMGILLPLLERAESLISVDTGPAHAAAALNCPTVALFGASDPHLYRPGGVTTPAVVLVGCIDGHADILGIEPARVIATWLELTRRGS
jgi:hypothetical protein